MYETDDDLRRLQSLLDRTLARANPKEERDVIATEGFHPGDACNGHSGFLAGDE